MEPLVQNYSNNYSNNFCHEQTILHPYQKYTNNLEKLKNESFKIFYTWHFDSTKENTNFNKKTVNNGTLFYEIWAYKSEKYAKNKQKWT